MVPICLRSLMIKVEPVAVNSMMPSAKPNPGAISTDPLSVMRSGSAPRPAKNLRAELG
jgi:hypothetical protein